MRPDTDGTIGTRDRTPSKSQSTSGTVLGSRFIVGNSRGGTSWLARCLVLHPDAVAFGETAYWGRGWVEPHEDGLYYDEHVARVLVQQKRATWSTTVGSGPGRLRNLKKEEREQFLDDVFSSVQTPIAPGALFERLERAIADREGKRYTIEKTPHHVMWVDRILRELPDARFVALQRDPYTFTRSYKHQGDRRDEVQRKRFARRYHPVSCAMLWRGVARSADAIKRRHPERVLVISFEDMEQHNEETLAEIQRFFGLEVHRLTLSEGGGEARNSSFPSGKAPELSGGEIMWLNLVAGKDFRRFGYAPRRSQFDPVGFVYWTIRLPVWAIANIRGVHERTAGNMFRYLVRWLRPVRPSAYGEA